MAPSDDSPASPTRIDASLLIPGRGEPVRDASLVFAGPRIVFAGSRASLPSDLAALDPVASVPVLMPGLWDCHAHFFGADRYSMAAASATPPALAGARGARDLAALLSAGFTSVREVGGYGASLARAVAEGWLPGPMIYPAVSMLSPTGGHADGQADDLPLDAARRKMRETQEGIPLYVCDGVDDCMLAVRLMRRRGARCIKVATSGAVSSPDPLEAQEFSPAELRAMVYEAARWDMAVAAHAHGTRGIAAALEAGCLTIEHGSYLAGDSGGDDHGFLEDMKRRGAILVATRAVLDFGVRHPEAWSPDMFAKMQAVDRASQRSYAAAIRAGVRIALGTDIGVSTKATAFNHGMNGREFRLAVEAGMTALQAIEAGTAMGPETLGKVQAGRIRSGQLREGYAADLIAVAESPLENIAVLERPDAVTHVWRAGRLYKSPERGVDILDC